MFHKAINLQVRRSRSRGYSCRPVIQGILTLLFLDPLMWGTVGTMLTHLTVRAKRRTKRSRLAQRSKDKKGLTAPLNFSDSGQKCCKMALARRVQYSSDRISLLACFMRCVPAQVTMQCALTEQGRVQERCAFLHNWISSWTSPSFRSFTSKQVVLAEDSQFPLPTCPQSRHPPTVHPRPWESPLLRRCELQKAIATLNPGSTLSIWIHLGGRMQWAGKAAV